MPQDPMQILQDALASDPPELTPEQKQQQDESEKIRKQTFDFNEVKPLIKELKQGFESEVTQTQANRERRKVDVNVKALRISGDIKQSDTMVPMRVIDEAIAREKPGFIAYLQQSRRLVIFSDVMFPNEKHDALEAAFTRGMTYNDWIIVHHKCLDGAQAHGWDWVEVLYDNSKPLHTSIEHVGHDRLYFSLDTEDIQNCARIMREFKLTRIQLDSFVKEFDFDQAQVAKLLANNEQKEQTTGTTKDHVYSVFKQYNKLDGVVYVSWLSLLGGCDDWLKAPQKFYNGVDEEVSVPQEQPPVPLTDPMTGMPVPHPITGEPIMQPQPPLMVKEWQPVDETEYPIVFLPYEETEEKEVKSKKGRVFKDKYKQEVMTSGWSAFLNGYTRATAWVGSKAEADGQPASSIQSINIQDGKILPFKVDWMRMPYPDPSMLEALIAFDSKIASGQGQMNYVVQNKSSGSRTTKAEVDQASQDTNLLASVNITLFSSYVRNTYAKAWRIVQSQALQDKINLLGDVQEIPNPQDPMEVEYLFVNNKKVIKRTYDIRPAGDVDFIQRQQMINDMMQFWEVVQNTPIAADFLAHLLKIKFGEQGDMWAQKLLMGDIKSQLLMQYAAIITGLVQNPAQASAIGPAEIQKLTLLLQETQQALQPAENTNGDTSTSKGQSASGGGGQQPNSSASTGQSPMASVAGNGTGNQGVTETANAS